MPSLKENTVKKVFPPDQTLPYDQTIVSALITHALQPTLEIEVMLTLYAQEVMRYVAYSGITYSNPALDLNFTVGEEAQHRFLYQLWIHDHYLGLIIYSRRTAFTVKEVKKCEELLAGLFYPLQNAINYRKTKASALSDCLTGLGNRAAFELALKRDVEIAKRHGEPLSIIVLDVDDFKKVNDKHGHKLGDEVLKAVAEVLKECVRGTDIVFRYGGEEFVILLSHTDLEGANPLAERIRERVENLKFKTKYKEIFVTMSIGITDLLVGDGQDTFFKRADQALYKAKQHGKNQVCHLSKSPAFIQEAVVCV